MAVFSLFSLMTKKDPPKLTAVNGGTIATNTRFGFPLNSLQNEIHFFIVVKICTAFRFISGLFLVQ